MRKKEQKEGEREQHKKQIKVEEKYEEPVGINGVSVDSDRLSQL